MLEKYMKIWNNYGTIWKVDSWTIWKNWKFGVPHSVYVFIVLNELRVKIGRRDVVMFFWVQKHFTGTGNWSCAILLGKCLDWLDLTWFDDKVAKNVFFCWIYETSSVNQQRLGLFKLQELEFSPMQGCLDWSKSFHHSLMKTSRMGGGLCLSHLMG